MRFLLLLAGLAFSAVFQPAGRGIDVGVWYSGPGVRPFSMPAGPIDEDTLRRDLAAIRRAGFNTVITWGEAAHQERVKQMASDAGLTVHAVSRESPVDSHGRIVVGGSPGSGAREARLALWQAVARGARTIGFVDADGRLTPALLALGETAGVITRNQALFGPLAPRDMRETSVRIEPDARVSVHMLESPEAIAIIGLNASRETRRVTITFPPDVPEAIWQNMESGTAVNFVLMKEGPVYRHTFAPHDALVLVIRKQLR